VLSRLTDEVEAFDSMLERQRRLLKKDADTRRAPEPGQLNKRSKRIRAAAAEIASRARGAIEELAGPGPGELRPAGTMEGFRATRSTKAR
jgi:hypothetical protein